jgi:hypothetical protein
MSQFSLLRQAGTSHIESRIASQYSMVADVPIKSAHLESIAEHAMSLHQGRVLPIGSVEFVRKAMELSGIAEPKNLSYPESLRAYLRRDVHQRMAGSVVGHWFLKPTITKSFTGFVFDTLANPDSLSPHDREQYSAFMALSPDTPIWVSEPVSWRSEYRYYVTDGIVRGEGRYDDGHDDAPVPDSFLVSEMAARLSKPPDAPAAFSLDVGVLDSGETALVEVNDAWALGFYKGSLSHKDYIDMLWQRWAQLARSKQD